MPRKGPAYPTTKEWKERVREAIDALKESGRIKSDAEFCRTMAKISPVTLVDSLKPEAKQSTVMVEIHRALKWPEPLKAPPNYVLELVHAFMALPERVQGEIVERVRIAAESARGKRPG